jgi:hypothetical protein
MNIIDTFLRLTQRTHPHGSEHELRPLLPSAVQTDEFGNFYVEIGQGDVVFAAHLDTASYHQVEVQRVFTGQFVQTDGNSILGADDQAGVTVLLYMIEQGVPGLYYFFVGEERSCIGSGQVADQHRRQLLPHIRKVVSFDRRGTSSVITFQGGLRTCSDAFAEALAVELNAAEPTFRYAPDPTGVYTDSRMFMDLYPECTNLSVGYENAHTFAERQDLDHLVKLARACSRVRWSELPVQRNRFQVEFLGY